MKRVENFCLHESTKKAFWEILKELLELKIPLRVDIKDYKKQRSKSQNALFHVWCEFISSVASTETMKIEMADIKDDLKKRFLGYEEIERVNYITGEIVTEKRLRRTRDLDTGDMFFFMTQIDILFQDRGLNLPRKENDEYEKLKRQNEGAEK